MHEQFRAKENHDNCETYCHLGPKSLLLLAPDIQEPILFLAASEGGARVDYRAGFAAHRGGGGLAEAMTKMGKLALIEKYYCTATTQNAISLVIRKLVSYVELFRRRPIITPFDTHRRQADSAKGGSP